MILPVLADQLALEVAGDFVGLGPLPVAAFAMVAERCLGGLHRVRAMRDQLAERTLEQPLATVVAFPGHGLEHQLAVRQPHVAERHRALKAGAHHRVARPVEPSVCRVVELEIRDARQPRSHRGLVVRDVVRFAAHELLAIGRLQHGQFTSRNACRSSRIAAQAIEPTS